MKPLNAHFALAAGLMVLLVSGAFADEAPALQHNPFSRPPSARTVIDFAGASNAGAPGVGINLMATMVVANKGLANVGGRILRPGDEVDGYSLLQVYEDRAVFLRDGKRLTIYVKPELVAEDE